MENESLIKIANLEQHYKQMQESLALIDNQILELEQFKESLIHIINTKEKEMLSSLGKGIHIKTLMDNKNELYVHVGANVIVKKTPQETLKVLDNQITIFKEARLQMAVQLNNYTEQLNTLVSQIDNQ